MLVSNIIKCPYCGSDRIRLDIERGETICENCGTVLEEHLIDCNVEYRIYTPIERVEKEHYRQGPLNPLDVLNFRKFKTTFMRLCTEFEIVKLCEEFLNKNDITKIIRRFTGNGYSITELAYAITYVLMKQHGYNVRAFIKVIRSRLGRRRRNKILKLVSEIERNHTSIDKILAKYADIVHTIVRKLPYTIIIKTLKSIHSRAGLLKSIIASIATTTYILNRILDNNITQKEIANISNVSDVTIRSRLRQIQEVKVKGWTPLNETVWTGLSRRDIGRFLNHIVESARGLKARLFILTLEDPITLNVLKLYIIKYVSNEYLERVIPTLCHPHANIEIGILYNPEIIHDLKSYNPTLHVLTKDNRKFVTPHEIIVNVIERFQNLKAYIERKLGTAPYIRYDSVWYVMLITGQMVRRFI